MKSDHKLRPCPFCGKEPELYRRPIAVMLNGKIQMQYGHTVTCLEPGCVYTRSFTRESADEAVQFWNESLERHCEENETFDLRPCPFCGKRCNTYRGLFPATVRFPPATCSTIIFRRLQYGMDGAQIRNLTTLHGGKIRLSTNLLDASKKMKVRFYV